MEELERYGIETLRHALAKVNADVAAQARQEPVRAEREAEARRQHDESVREIVGRLRFDL
jgi:hypothetical protein